MVKEKIKFGWKLIKWGVLIVGALWVILAISILTYRIFGTYSETTERKVFEKSQSYTHGAQQDIARYYLEWMREPDPIARKAIVNTVRLQFAQFPSKEIKDPVIREWFEDCLRGNMRRKEYYR